LINHNQVFFSHLSVIGQFIASDLWLMAYCRMALTLAASSTTTTAYCKRRFTFLYVPWALSPL